MHKYTTISIYPQTKHLIDSLYLEFSRFEPVGKVNFLHIIFELLSKASLDTFSFFHKTITNKYEKDYEIIVAPLILADINNKTFYNIYSELKDYNFNVLYSVGDKHKALLFIKQDILSKLI